MRSSMAIVVALGERRVRVYYAVSGEWVMLTGLEAISGPAPDWEHLRGSRFPDLDALGRAVEAALRGSVGDTLDLVDLSFQVYRQWMDLAAAAARRWVREGRIRDAAAIPDERARVLADGSLEIVVEIPGDRVALTVPPDQWAWRHRPS